MQEVLAAVPSAPAAPAKAKHPDGRASARAPAPAAAEPAATDGAAQPWMEVIEEGEEAVVAAEAPLAEEAVAAEAVAAPAEPTSPRIRFAEDLVAAGALPARKKKAQKVAGKA